MTGPPGCGKTLLAREVRIAAVLRNHSLVKTPLIFLSTTSILVSTACSHSRSSKTTNCEWPVSPHLISGDPSSDFDPITCVIYLIVLSFTRRTVFH